MLRNGSGDSSGRESDWSSLSLSSWKGGIQAEGQGGGRGCQVLLLTKLPFLSIISCRLVLLGLCVDAEQGWTKAGLIEDVNPGIGSAHHLRHCLEALPVTC